MKYNGKRITTNVYMKNRKTILMVLMAALACQVINAQDVFTTKGDGTTYNIKMLTGIAGAGIETFPKDEGNAAMPKYGLTKSITIAEGDKFVMDSCIKLLFARDVHLLSREKATSAKRGLCTTYMMRMSRLQPRFV
jgi:hypothetical protein